MPASRQGTISANCLTCCGIRNTSAQTSIPAATNDRIAAEPKLLALRCNEWRFRQRAVLVAGSKVQLDGCYDALRYFKAQSGTADPIDLELRQKNCRYVNRPAGTLSPISHEELWRRWQRFLEDMIPVADQSGVQLAAHPDDPPMPTMRGQPRLVYQPHMYQRLLDIAPSRSNALELCVGTIAEMTEGDVYDAVDQYSRRGNIAYLHLRNVVGKVPHYRETFIDEGDVDMIRILSILKRNNFDGVIIPDHSPQMTCPAPWHAGMAHTLGFILAAKAMLESSSPNVTER